MWFIICPQLLWTVIIVIIKKKTLALRSQIKFQEITLAIGWCTYFDWSTGCIQARAPSGSSLRVVTGPRGWLRSLPVGGKPNIKPLAPRGPVEGYNLRPHSNSRVGQGDAELKPGAASSDLSLNFLFAPTEENWINFFLVWPTDGQDHF